VERKELQRCLSYGVSRRKLKAGISFHRGIEGRAFGLGDPNQSEKKMDLRGSSPREYLGEKLKRILEGLYKPSS